MAPKNEKQPTKSIKKSQEPKKVFSILSNKFMPLYYNPFGFASSNNTF